VASFAIGATIASCPEAGGTITLTIGTLAAGATAVVTIVAIPTAAAAGTITDTACSTQNEFDPNTANNCDTEVTTIRVANSTPPVVTVPADITAEATGAGGAAVSFPASANDDVDGPLSATCSPASGETFPLGPTTVTCSATDAAGNTGSANFTVTVVDTTQPIVTCSDIGPLEGNTLGGFQGNAGYGCAASDIVAGDVSAV